MYFEKAEMKGQNEISVLQLCRKSMPGCIFTQKVFILFKKSRWIAIKLSGSSLKLALFATPAFLAQMGLHVIFLSLLKDASAETQCRVALLCSLQQIPGSHSFMLVLPSAFLFPPGCRRQWDNITCWPEAQVGAVVVKPCPKYFRFLTTFLGKKVRLGEMFLWLRCL